MYIWSAYLLMLDLWYSLKEESDPYYHTLDALKQDFEWAYVIVQSFKE